MIRVKILGLGRDKYLMIPLPLPYLLSFTRREVGAISAFGGHVLAEIRWPIRR